MGYKLPVSLLVLGLAAVPLLNAATRTATSRHNRTPRAVSSTSHRRHSSSSKRSSQMRGKNSQRSRKPNAYQRLAKMQVEPERVASIQKALGDAGAYHGTPTGRWDSDTRDAMARYQSQNGFGVTGLPDAKSLMKLGLGPHPLPAELDKTRAFNLQPNSGGATHSVSADSPASESSPSVTGPSQDPPR